jgi:hypothetical protein
MNEDDTCCTYILPKLKSAGWEDESITEQLVLTPGQIVGYLDVLYPSGHLLSSKGNLLEARF